MNDIKTHYQYDIQRITPWGRWESIVNITHSTGAATEIFNLYKNRYGVDVRLMRRKITVGEWEVQK